MENYQENHNNENPDFDEPEPEIEPMRDGEVIESILEKGDAIELEELRVFWNFTKEQINRYSLFVKDRKLISRRSRLEEENRVINNPNPTQEELDMGAFKETIEYQVVDAVMQLRRKGYNTYYSGFEPPFCDKQVILWENKIPENATIAKIITNELKDEDVSAKIDENGIELLFNKYIEPDQIKKIWDKVAESLPDLEMPAQPVSKTGQAEAFRRGQFFVFYKNVWQEEMKKTGKNSLAPKFMQQQIHLVRNQWSREFNDYVNEKIRENENEETRLNRNENEISPQKEIENTYRRYLEDLGLNEKDLKNKKILDLGTGPNGEFVKYCLDKSIAKDVYGIDRMLSEADIGGYRDHLIKGDFTEELPVKNCDLIIAHGSPMLGLPHDKDVGDAIKTISNALNALNQNGEIRISVTIDSFPPMKGIIESSRNLNLIMNEIVAKNNVEYNINPRDIRVIGQKNDIVIDAILTIEKNKTEGATNDRFGKK
jgi:hypothetical protein